MTVSNVGVNECHSEQNLQQLHQYLSFTMTQVAAAGFGCPSRFDPDAA